MSRERSRRPGSGGTDHGAAPSNRIAPGRATLTSQRYVRAPVRSPSSAEKPAERPEPQPTGEAASFEYEPSAAPVHTDAAPGGEVVQRKATTGPDGGLGREPVAGRAIPVRPGY